eukprot:CAMPEP_0201592806 /NCGR_PEP_ID=MMETSP0190_2-20130828/190600_1 /ASSEMBLY_ACC=CAM_ASM_000263 /TAXON_ID=37353 /ORGANISM="Rosalina sp." /LENGTH=567 /DNA_ID=CAMNT_0048051739 /DNA_START=72 /DNA_END=1775 /DNA_ORIENTATION=-
MSENTKEQQSKSTNDDEKKQESPGPRVLLADKMGPFVEETLKKNGCEVVWDASLSGDSLKQEMSKFQPNVIVVRSTKVTKEHLMASSSLALIVRAGAGVNTIAVDEASNMGIFVANCPGKNAIAVAELAMGHLINLDRRIADNVIQIREGKWNKKDDDEKKQESPGPRVLLADKMGPFVEETLKKNGCEVVWDASLNGDSLKQEMSKFQPNVIVVRSTKVTKEHLSASSSLSLVVRAGAGVNTIAVDEASNMGIFVANCPGKNAIAVAELAMGHLINLDRRIADNVIQIREGKWNKKEFGKARGLFGRKIAVLGIGNIGRETCKRAVSFGMNVNGYSRSLTEEQAKSLGINYCKSMEEAVTGCDALSIHLPHNDNTHYIINKSIIGLMNDGAYVVNTSRGGVVNEKDMLLMIKEKNIRYAADVYENEPKSSDKEFTDKEILSNTSIYGSHHIGASTDQASDAVGAETLRVIQTFLNTGEVVNCVNLERQSPAKYSLVIRHKDVVGVLAEILNILKNNDINVQEMSNIVFKGAKSACATLQIDHKPSQSAVQTINDIGNVYGVEVSSL